MRASSARRIANMHRLAAALAAGGSMELAELTRVLQVSERTVRDYLAEFEHSGIARRDPERRAILRLHPDSNAVHRFLQSLGPNGVVAANPAASGRDPLVTALFGHVSKRSS
jgi:hypothetical protein